MFSTLTSLCKGREVVEKKYKAPALLRDGTPKAYPD